MSIFKQVSKTINTMKKRHKQKLVIISIILFVMFNAPFLLLFNRVDQLLGFPMIYTYIFLVWLCSSVATFLVFKKFDE